VIGTSRGKRDYLKTVHLLWKLCAVITEMNFAHSLSGRDGESTGTENVLLF